MYPLVPTELRGDKVGRNEKQYEVRGFKSRLDFVVTDLPGKNLAIVPSVDTAFPAEGSEMLFEFFDKLFIAVCIGQEDGNAF